MEPRVDDRMYSTLIGAAALATHLRENNWRVVDCRFDLAQPAAGRNAYEQAHISGAIYADLNADLSAPITTSSGRHPLPDPMILAERFGHWGIDHDTQVIAYDAGNGAFAARLWWLLRWLGHRRIAVLDGGFKQWLSEGLPVTAEIPRVQPRRFEPQLASDGMVDATQLAQYVTRAEWRVLDARAAERYAGLVEPIDPVAGHIPGAHNHPFTRNLDAAGHFLSPVELRTRFETNPRTDT